MIEVGLIASCSGYRVLLGRGHLLTIWGHEIPWIMSHGLLLLLLLKCV